MLRSSNAVKFHYARQMQVAVDTWTPVDAYIKTPISPYFPYIHIFTFI